jgi:hypothetical protein
MGSDNLIENNIFQHVTAPMMNNASASGSVFGYNFAINDFYTVSPSFMQASNYHHAAGLDMVLHEGNDAIGFEGDLVHGTHHFLTAFRNVFPGWEPTKTSQTIAVNLYAFNRYMNIVGNILGTAGYHTNYQYKYPGPTGTLDRSIYAIGWPGNIVASDNNVGKTLMRWGNYDTVTAAVQWNAIEVPAGLSQYANPVPLTQILPASFYLSSKPSWLRTILWPPIGPDVTGGDISGIGGHAYRNPAHVCYDNALKVGGILTFNANNCYGNTAPAPPTPPKNLKAQ